MSPMPHPYPGVMSLSLQPSANNTPFNKFMNFFVQKSDLSERTFGYGKLEVKMM